MTVLLSSLAFFLLLSVLILIHEWGHYYAAKRSGVVVEEFGFGLPPRAWTLFKRSGTDFTLNWIPFGGFVRLKGENAVDAKQHMAPGSFGAASVPARIVILCGGVFMNFMLAMLILTFGFSIGQWVPVYSTLEAMEADAERGYITFELGVRIDEVLSGGAAAKVGVPEDSLIVAIDGTLVVHPEDVSALQQGKRQVEYVVATGADHADQQSFILELDEGKSGVVIVAHPKHLAGTTRSLLTGFWMALRESWSMMQQTTKGMMHLFMSLASSGQVPEGITGIVGIAQYTHTSVQEGFGAYLRLVALLNLSLAALNILPFPALDGGRLLFVIAEVIARKPVNRKVELITNGVGFVLLLLLILLITYNDIIRIIFS